MRIFTKSTADQLKSRLNYYVRAIRNALFKKRFSYADLVGTWCTQTESGIHKYIFDENHLVAVIRTEENGARYPGTEYSKKYGKGDKLILVHTAKYGSWIDTWGHYTGDTVVFISQHKKGSRGKEDVNIYNWKFRRCGESAKMEYKKIKPRPRTCMVCGKTGLMYPTEASDKQFDDVARECPRCWSQICVFCLKKLPKHEDGSASLCPACNKYGIFEITGHSPASRENCKQYAEETYGK